MVTSPRHSGLFGVNCHVGYFGYTPRVQTGIVEYKLITGMNDQQLYVLWLDTGGRAITIAENLRGGIAHDDDLKVSQTFENRIKHNFTDIQYRASIRLCGANRIHSFSVSRDVFNAIEVNSVFKFETQRSSSHKIRKIEKENDYVLFVSEPPYPDPNYRVQYMHE